MGSPTSIDPVLRERARGACELCATTGDLGEHWVTGGPSGVAGTLVACGTCRAQLDGSASFDAARWFGLRETIWSDVPAVQVQSWRLLKRLSGEGWARDLLEQVYLDEERAAWAEAGTEEADESPTTIVVDSNGTPLVEGDAVTLIKDLDVKGAGFTAKRGTLVKNIRLTGDPAHVEARVNGVAIVLKTVFLKKAN